MTGLRGLTYFLLLSCISWVKAERINAIATKTSDCFFCGMVEGVGYLTVQVCGSSDCCLSRSLDSDGSVDWLPGATDTFQGTKYDIALPSQDLEGYLEGVLGLGTGPLAPIGKPFFFNPFLKRYNADHNSFLWDETRQ